MNSLFPFHNSPRGGSIVATVTWKAEKRRRKRGRLKDQNGAKFIIEHFFIVFRALLHKYLMRFGSAEI